MTLLIDEADMKVYRDFHYSPSKIRAATEAVKEQHKASELIACLELQTYSNLNKDFLMQYRNALSHANISIIFYNEETIVSKGADNISLEWIKTAFEAPNLKVFTSRRTLQDYLTSLDKQNKVFLFMSSGNYGGIPLEKLLE